MISPTHPNSMSATARILMKDIACSNNNRNAIWLRPGVIGRKLRRFLQLLEKAAGKSCWKKLLEKAAGKSCWKKLLEKVPGDKCRVKSNSSEIVSNAKKSK
jgi:hypothetical protein